MDQSKIKKLKYLVLTLLLLSPTLVFAHSNDDASGFVSGFLHPLLGFDHLLAMLGVGLISARIKGHYIWTVPAIFVSFMVVGGSIGAYGIEFPMVEIGIATSVIVIGAAIALVKKSTMTWTSVVMVFVAFFGALHGHAHGLEMPNSASPIYYSMGFVIATSTIHLIGVAIGMIPYQSKKLASLPSYLGSAISLAGCVIMYGLIV